MDRREIFLISDFGEVLPHLDDVVRKVILDERVPYSTRLPQTISCGELKIPRLCVIETPIKVNAFSLRSNDTHVLKTHKETPAARLLLSGKKRKALPYEKLAVVTPQTTFPPYKKKNGSFCKSGSPANISKQIKSLPYQLTENKKVQNNIFQFEDTDDLPVNERDLKSSRGRSNSDTSDRTCVCNCNCSTKLKDLPVETCESNTSNISTLLNKDLHRYQSVKSDKEESRAILSTSPSSIPCPETLCLGITLPCGSKTSSPHSSPRESAKTLSALPQRETQLTPTVLPLSSKHDCPTLNVAAETRKHIPTFYSDNNSKDLPTEEENVINHSKYPAEIGTLDVKEMDTIIQTLVEAQKVYVALPNMAETINGAECMAKKTDTTNVKKALLKSFVLYFEKKIVETVQFAKRIPGFLDLPRDDQANLIRESRNESDLISGMKCFDDESKSFASIDGHFFKLEDLRNVLSEDTLKIYVEGATKVAKLNASLEEAALLRAITITFSDRCELQCREQVEDIQNRLISCLLYIVYNGPVPSGKRIGQMFDFLLFCRNVTEIALQNFKKILIEENKYNESPIVNEIL